MDLGQGATDHGFGAAAALAAAEAILRSGLKPRRTIRFVLFTGEEQGILGSRAYVGRHPADMANHLAAVIMDQGDGPLTSLWLNGRDDLIPALEQFLPLVPGGGQLKVVDSLFLFSHAFAFTLAGVPAIDLGQDSPDYKYTHHSSVDTLDKVKPEMLIRNTAMMAL